MDTLAFILQIVLWPMCLLIIGLILLQGGAGDLSSAFGGGGQLDSTLGVGAGRKMSKLTAWLAIGFLAIITFLSRSHGQHVAERSGGAAAVPTMSAPLNQPIPVDLTAPSGATAPAVPVAPPGATSAPDATAPTAGATAPAAPADPTPAPAAVVPAPAIPPAAAAAPAPADAAPAKLKLDE